MTNRHKYSAAALLLLLSACGTVFGGMDQMLTFDANVKGVKIFIDGMEACKTPCVFPVKRSSSATIITAKKDGYEDKQIALRSNFNTVAILNLTFWPSWLTDVATGGMWQYSRDSIYVDMEKENLAAADYDQTKRNVAVRRFALFAFPDLRLEAAAGNTAGEYMTALAALTDKDAHSLLNVVNDASSPVGLAHTLTGITQ